MPKPIKKDELVATNPKVNAEQLEQGLDAVRQLRSQGFGRPGYNLVRPFTRRLVRTQSSQPKPRNSGDRRAGSMR
jgi:hypothetical protein